MFPELPPFTDARVLVIGDVMLDRYWHGVAERISPEAPVPVVNVGGAHERPGGAGNVAVNLARLGVRTVLFAVTGDDAEAEVLERGLVAAGVEPVLSRSKGARTTTKLRVTARNQQLIRLDFDHMAPDEMARKAAGEAAARVEGMDAVVLSDYRKGTLTHAAGLIGAARAAGVPVLVDPKTQGLERYRGATLLTPNRAEFVAMAGEFADDAELETRAREVLERESIGYLLVTRSEEGMSLIGARESLHLTARSREVYDVTGAGDTVIAVAAACLAAGLDIRDAARLANLAAGVVVGKLGAVPVTPGELEFAMQASHEGVRGILDGHSLLECVRAARECGERIVMTNGCFDLLHAGHVGFLAEASRHGDRLVVAVNDDASVRRLKGEGRPVNPLEHRMAVLAGLSSVDWVVPFSTDTPEPLIREILPDVLVKGGDYSADDIAGADAVRAAGGAVRVLGYREGYSTSRLIDSIRKPDP